MCPSAQQTSVLAGKAPCLDLSSSSFASRAFAAPPALESRLIPTSPKSDDEEFSLISDMKSHLICGSSQSYRGRVRSHCQEEKSFAWSVITKYDLTDPLLPVGSVIANTLCSSLMSVTEAVAAPAGSMASAVNALHSSQLVFRARRRDGG